MAYDSDTRVKETLKDISRKAELNNLILRIFDESNEDQKHWIKGGLTFGPIECLYGSNDAGWFLKRPYIISEKKMSDFTPVLVVEGSYGTETGNTGSAQYARFSHALGAVKEGFIGVYFIPFESIYRKKEGSETKAYVRPEMIYAALNASQVEKGTYLFIDAYDQELMIEFLKVLDKGDNKKAHIFIERIKKIMKEFADKHTSSSRMKYIYLNNRIGKLLMFNVVAFSAYNYRTKTKYRAGRFRNGHTILGTGLLNLYLHRKHIDLILPRFTYNDCRELDKTSQKEWKLLRKTEGINIITLDDIVFQDDDLRDELHNFLDVLPLKGDNYRKKESLVKEIRKGFKNCTIKIKRENENK